MRPRAALLLAAAALIPAAMATRGLAVAPCLPGQRPGTVAALRFALAPPGAAPVSAAAWQAFRADTLEPTLGPPLGDAEETPDPRRPRERWRSVMVEVDVRFEMTAPDRLPATVRAVLAAWSARFPAAPAEGRLRPACFPR